MDGQAGPLLTLMAAAIAGLFAALMSVAWFVLRYLRGRVTELEAREQQTLVTLVESVKGVRDMLAGVVEVLREMRAMWFDIRRDRDRDRESR